MFWISFNLIGVNKFQLRFSGTSLEDHMKLSRVNGPQIPYNLVNLIPAELGLSHIKIRVISMHMHQCTCFKVDMFL